MKYYVESACMSLNNPIINCATSAFKLDIAYVVWFMIIVSQDVLIAVPKLLRIEPQFLGINGNLFHYGT
jgi:hypothetical protein